MAQPSPSVVLSKRVDLPNSGKQAIIVSINRPDRLNCFNRSVCIELSSIFNQIAAEINQDDDASIAAIIFTGEGKSFCAGADLSNPPNPLDQSSDLPHHLIENPVHQLGRIRVPVIGALRGHCITGGFELALACDILVGDTSTKFRDTHVKFGLAPCWGLSQKLQRRIGPGRAKLVSFTAAPITSTVALGWGLLDEVVSDGKGVVDRAIEIADSIGMNDGVMVKRYKRVIEEGGATDLNSGLKRERELGIAHYIEAMGQDTFQSAKKYITDEARPRLKSKL